MRRRITRRRWAWFEMSLAGLGAVLVLSLILPLVVLLLGSSPAALYATAREGEVARSFRVTFEAACLAMAIGLLLGVPLGYTLARRSFRGRALIESLVNLPVIVPHTSAGVALLLTYGARGPLGALLARAGIFLTDRLGGIVLGMLFVGAPFLVAAVREAVAGVPYDLEEAARVDGASGWATLWRVTLPLARRGIASGALLMWARGISEFGAVVILAYHPRTLAVLTYERFLGFGLPRAAPLAALLVIVALLIFVLLNTWLRPTDDA